MQADVPETFKDADELEEDNWKRIVRNSSTYGPDDFVKAPLDCGPLLAVGREQG
jgi:hypothetical protein